MDEITRAKYACSEFHASVVYSDRVWRLEKFMKIHGKSGKKRKSDKNGNSRPNESQRMCASCCNAFDTLSLV